MINEQKMIKGSFSTVIEVGRSREKILAREIKLLEEETIRLNSYLLGYFSKHYCSCYIYYS